jgi:hypothetical protein
MSDDATKRAPGQLGTLLRFAWQQLFGAKAADRKIAPVPNFAALMPVLMILPEAARPRLASLTLAARHNDWRGTGLTLKRGEAFSVFADGAVWISKFLGVGAEPKLALWLRLAARGPIRKMPGNAGSFQAWADGEIELCLKPPGEWADESGAFDPAYPHSGGEGEVKAVIALWPCPAADGLAALAHQADFAALAKMAEKRSVPPQDWNYLWRLGDGAIYEPSTEGGKPAIHVHTHGDVGILQYAVDMPLADDTVLEWRWRVERLPSDLPEHIQPTHDYLSIAVEFDNGRDLTYYWSSSLAEGTVFHCPLPWWSERETHWVLRSGTRELGRWLNERRSVKADYEKAIGGMMPARIVRVWLIANSVFQRGHGVADFADIALSRAGTRTAIL